MDAVNALLDNAKKMCGIATDSELAARLRVRPSAVSNWRNGRAKPDVVAAAALAEMTNEKLARVVALLEEARAVSKEAKAIWRKIATAAVVCLAVYTSIGSPDAHARNDLTYAEQSRHYALSRWLARFLRFVRSLTESKGTGPHVAATVC